MVAEFGTKPSGGAVPGGVWMGVMGISWDVGKDFFLFN